ERPPMRWRFCVRSCSAASPALRLFRTLNARLLIGHDRAIPSCDKTCREETEMTTWGGICKEVCLAGSAAGPVFLLCSSASAAETTYQRLLNARAEPQNWLMRMGSYGNWNHSGLDQINKTNVANLRVKFMASLSDPNRPSKGSQYFTPLVEDGFMYVGNQYQQYWKFDVRDEKPKPVWKFDAKVQGGAQSLHSVALLGNNVYINTGRDGPNPRLIALDKNSGEVVFDVNTAI